jgi:hypothetical protein
MVLSTMVCLIAIGLSAEKRLRRPDQAILCGLSLGCKDKDDWEVGGERFITHAPPTVQELVILSGVKGAIRSATYSSTLYRTTAWIRIYRIKLLQGPQQSTASNWRKLAMRKRRSSTIGLALGS